MAYTVMSNMSESDKRDAHLENIQEKDIIRLRELAKQWMEIASLDVMAERKLGWKSLHGLKPIRPMILFETYTVSGFVNDDKELSCQNELLRNIEKTLVYGIKQVNDLGR